MPDPPVQTGWTPLDTPLDTGQAVQMAEIDPEARRQALDLLKGGKSVRETHAELERRGLQISRGAVGNLRKEALGPAEEDPAAASRRAIQEAAAQAAPDPGTPDYLADLQGLYKGAMAVARSPGLDPRVQMIASKQAADLLEQLRAMERENTDQGPRVVLYFPHELHLEHSR